MPFTHNEGARIYWDEQGSGDPVLLIMGLGYPAVMWFRTRPTLAKEFRTIAFDNRGVGQSDIPVGPYSIALMASDAKAVLDAAEVDRAHVYGVSMGGMIAQEFALRYPERVRSLVLGCTASGGSNAVRAEQEVVEFLTKRQPSQEAAVEAAVPYIYDSNTPRAMIDEDIAVRKNWLPKPEAYFAQLHGILSWEGYSRLGGIKAPTLVIHGESDRLVPCGNAHLIANRIEGATLKLFPNAGHIFTTDQTELSVTTVLQFLRAH
jgi:pimeloyl-ACP methyl ester carboxylesterase